MSDAIPPQAVSSCPLCSSDVAVSTYVVNNGEEFVHVEFCYKCFRCGWSLSCPEKYL